MKSKSDISTNISDPIPTKNNKNDSSGDLINQSFNNSAPAFELLLDGVLSSDNSRVKSVIAQYPESIKSQDAEGNFVIHYTTDCDMVKLLVKAGSDVNAKNNQGYAPLINAVIDSAYDTMLFLLENGADPTIAEPVLDIQIKHLCEYPILAQCLEEYETAWQKKNESLLGEQQALEMDSTGTCC